MTATKPMISPPILCSFFLDCASRGRFVLWEPPALEGTEPGHGKFRGFTFGGLNERNMALLSRIKTRYKVCATALKTHEKLFLERSRLAQRYWLTKPRFGTRKLFLTESLKNYP